VESISLYGKVLFGKEKKKNRKDTWNIFLSRAGKVVESLVSKSKAQSSNSNTVNKISK
jgi:hypothetical protein